MNNLLTESGALPQRIDDQMNFPFDILRHQEVI